MTTVKKLKEPTKKELEEIEEKSFFRKIELHTGRRLFNKPKSERVYNGATCWNCKKKKVYQTSCCYPYDPRPIKEIKYVICNECKEKLKNQP